MKPQFILKFDGSEYPISFPNVGQFIEIESMKLSFTKGRYVSLSLSEQKSSAFALDMADAISYLSVLAPKLKEDLEIKGWWDIELTLVKKIIDAYRKQFIPWFKPIMEDLYRYDEEDKDESETQE